MRWDLLLEWMTHTGSGQWGAFRAAIDGLSTPDGPEPQQLARRLRIALSDFGHVDFFLNGTRGWQVLAPAFVGLAASNQAIFVGGRTRRLVDEIKRAGELIGALVSIAPIECGPSRIHLEADDRILRKIAAAVNLPYIPQAAVCLASRCTPLRRSLEQAALCAEPVNWSVQSWSFANKKWLPECLQNTAREYKNRYGVRRYMIAGDRSLREMEKRQSVYAAALVNHETIARYQRENRSIVVPLHAPLPADYSRAACLAGGTLAAVRGGDLIFENVAPKVAEILLVALGHRYTLGRGVQ